MTMFPAQYFEQIQIGDRQVTKGRTITEADLSSFASLTWDTYSLHTDAEYAKKTIFGERIAHGMLVLSYALGLLSQEPSTLLAFYGIDNLRFIAPTKVGDTIRVEAAVVAKEDKGLKGGVVASRLLVKNQRGETTLDAVVKGLVARSPLPDEA